MELGKHFASFPFVWIVEDDSPAFKSGRGQVALVVVRSDGWIFEPAWVFFEWATPLNQLRTFVALFQMMRNQKDVGACMVRVLDKDKKMMERMKKYRVLFYRGRIPNGSANGDICLFSINGKKVPG